MKFNFKNIVLSTLVAGLLLGCAKNEVEKEDKVVLFEGNNGYQQMSEERIVNSPLTTKSMTEFSRSEIIIEENGNEISPSSELLEIVDATTFNNQKLGDIIKILTSNFKNTSVVFEPNIDPNIQIYMRTGKMKLYNLIQQIVKNAGYHAYYDPQNNSLNISPFQTRKYKIPAGLFVKKEVDQKLGNSGGAATASIVLNSESPIDAFNAQIDLLGSSNKLVNFDRSSGTLFVKEHPIYLGEIDDFVVDFVKDRSRKFIVETAIFDVVLANDRSVGLDLENLTLNGLGAAGLKSIGLSNLGGSAAGMILNVDKKQYGSVYDPATGEELKPGMNGRSFNVVLNMMKENKNSILVDKSKTILNNHDVNYIGNGSTVNYVESIETNVNESGTTIYVPKTAKAFDGITFVSRVDGFKNKNYIEVSLAPSVKKVTIEKGAGASLGGVIAADLINEDVRETMSTVNIKDGEIIVIGGLIREEDITSEKRNPLLEDIPFVKNLLGTKGSGKVRIETVFVVSVQELHNVEQSYKIPSSQIKPTLQEKY